MSCTSRLSQLELRYSQCDLDACRVSDYCLRILLGAYVRRLDATGANQAARHVRSTKISAGTSSSLPSAKSEPLHAACTMPKPPFGKCNPPTATDHPDTPTLPHSLLHSDLQPYWTEQPFLTEDSHWTKTNSWTFPHLHFSPVRSIRSILASVIWNRFRKRLCIMIGDRMVSICSTICWTAITTRESHLARSRRRIAEGALSEGRETWGMARCRMGGEVRAVPLTRGWIEAGFRSGLQMG